MKVYRTEKQQTTIDPWQSLANAVILQAVKDWQNAVDTLSKRHWNEEARQIKDECERFFLSEWFEMMTSLNGNMLLNKLKEDAGIDDR